MTTRRRVWASKSPGKIIARYTNGTLVKGYTFDFDPDQPCFHVVPEDDAGREATEVRIDDLKAVFFVRSFEGDREYDESNDLYVDRPPGTRKVRVTFADSGRSAPRLPRQVRYLAAPRPDAS